MSAFRISVGLPGGEELTRIMAGQLARTLTALSGWRTDPEAVFHETRRRLKKVRAAARIMREADDTTARAINVACRAAGQTLGAGRDSDVVRRTALNLAEAITHPEARAALQRFVATQTAHTQEPFDRTAAVRDALRAMQPIVPLLGTLHRQPAPPMATRDAAARIARRAHRTFDAAHIIGADADARHEWRKRVKDLGYAARLMRDVWPLDGEPPIDLARHVGQLLGQERDLVLLAAVINETATPPDTGFAAALSVIDDRRAVLARRADALGRVLHGRNG